MVNENNGLHFSLKYDVQIYNKSPDSGMVSKKVQYLTKSE